MYLILHITYIIKTTIDAIGSSSVMISEKLSDGDLFRGFFQSYASEALLDV